MPPDQWPNPYLLEGQELYERDTWIHPDWRRETAVRIYCETCHGFWWDRDHPFTRERLYENRVLDMSPPGRQCMACGGWRRGNQHRVYGAGYHPITHAWMVYLGGWTTCTHNEEGRYGMYIWDLPLFDFTYPCDPVFRPYNQNYSGRNNMFLTLPQALLPTVVRRAEYEWLPAWDRVWENPNYHPRFRVANQVGGEGDDFEISQSLTPPSPEPISKNNPEARSSSTTSNNQGLPAPPTQQQSLGIMEISGEGCGLGSSKGVTTDLCLEASASPFSSWHQAHPPPCMRSAQPNFQVPVCDDPTTPPTPLGLPRRVPKAPRPRLAKGSRPRA